MAPYDLVQSVGRALDILELIGNSEAGMRRQTVINITQLKSPTAYNLLRTLVAKGFLIKRRNPIRYYLGPTMVSLRRAQRDYELFQRAKPVMMNITATFGGDTRLCECVGMRIMSMLVVTPGQLGVLQPHLPHHMMPYGIGSVFQAYWDKHQQVNYEKGFPFDQHGKKKWKSRDRFNRFLAGFRKNRVAMMPVALSGGHFRVAAPIFGPGGHVVAIICFVKAIEKTNAVFRRKCCQAIRQAGVELSFDGTTCSNAAHTASSR